jgi:hypothetical protein
MALSVIASLLWPKKSPGDEILALSPPQPQIS